MTQPNTCVHATALPVEGEDTVVGVGDVKGSSQGTKVSVGNVRVDSSLCVLKPPKTGEVEEAGALIPGRRCPVTVSIAQAFGCQRLLLGSNKEVLQNV